MFCTSDPIYKIEKKGLSNEPELLQTSLLLFRGYILCIGE